MPIFPRYTALQTYLFICLILYSFTFYPDIHITVYTILKNSDVSIFCHLLNNSILQYLL